MTTALERVRKELLLGALEGPLPLTAVDSCVTQQDRSAPDKKLQNATLETIRSLVSEGLVVLGDLSGETGRLVAWSGSLEESMQKLSDLYVHSMTIRRPGCFPLGLSSPTKASRWHARFKKALETRSDERAGVRATLP